MVKSEEYKLTVEDAEIEGPIVELMTKQSQELHKLEL